MGWLDSIKAHARALKAETLALLLAARDPRTPWLARLLIIFVVAYVLSPIDLIPDFIPVLGYLDDLVLVPLGLTLAIRLVPPPVLAECRARAAEVAGRARRIGWIAAALIGSFWIGLGWWLYLAWQGG